LGKLDRVTDTGPTGAARVLVVEDDRDLRRLLKRGLQEEGFEIETTSTGHDAIRTATQKAPDLLVIDIGLPDADGRDLCQALRAQGVAAPVLFLTALDAVTDRISGFVAGGDDYLTKPFALGELVMRLRALTKRHSDQAIEVGELRLDPVTHSVFAGKQEAALTPTEFRVLGALVARSGEAVRRIDLIHSGWPHGAVVHDNTLDVYIRRIRKKLDSIGATSNVTTVHRVGYRI
jgi:two-component system, OmpR family, response regulator